MKPPAQTVDNLACNDIDKILILRQKRKKKKKEQQQMLKSRNEHILGKML